MCGSITMSVLTAVSAITMDLSKKRHILGLCVCVCVTQLKCRDTAR